MTVDQVEELIRKYLSMGITLVVVLIGPATAPGAPGAPQVITVVPGPSTSARAAPTTAAPPTTVGAPAATDYPSTGSPAPTTKKEKEHQPEPTGATPTTSTSTTPDRTRSTTAAEPTATGGPTVTPAPTTTTAPRTTAPATTAPATQNRAAPASGAGGTTAAAAFGWGAPNRQDDFTGDLSGWGLYDGPGHADQGRRSPAAATVENGVLTIAGDAEGTTGGMAWKSGQEYGRWEGRVKAPVSDPSYNALMLLWPDAENFPAGGEIDFMEMTDSTRQSTDLFVHHGADNAQVHGLVEVDATQWHNWAVEWTPQGITAFVDGKRWWHSDDTAILPPGPMHLCLQLDWFPKNGEGAVRPSQMQVDWVRQYSLDSTGDPKPGAPSTDTQKDSGRGSVMREVIERMFGWS